MRLFLPLPDRPPRPRPRPALLVLLLGLLAPAAGLAASVPSPRSDPAAEAWREAARYLFRESEAAFAAAPDGPEARLGRAALLLMRQPRTRENLDHAAAELEALAAAPAPDPVAPLARYLLARVEHVHRFEPDLAAAAGHYRRLAREHPEHLLAAQAWARLALIELYAPGLPDAELRKRHADFAARADTLAPASARRDLHLVLGAAARHHGLGDEAILRHYSAAERTGIARPVQRAGVLVIIGETARRLGRHELARAHFERFLAEFPRDYRRRTVRDRLAALPPAPAST